MEIFTGQVRNAAAPERAHRDGQVLRDGSASAGIFFNLLAATLAVAGCGTMRRCKTPLSQVSEA